MVRDMWHDSFSAILSPRAASAATAAFAADDSAKQVSLHMAFRFKSALERRSSMVWRLTAALH